MHGFTFYIGFTYLKKFNFSKNSTQIPILFREILGLKKEYYGRNHNL